MCRHVAGKKRRHGFALLVAAVAILGLAGISPAAAQADCSRWNVLGKWTVVQSNHFRVDFTLEQFGATLTGNAVYGNIVNGRGSITRGNVQGTIAGNVIELNVDWGGVYRGTIDATGRIDGTTYDRKDSTSSATWYSDRRMTCLARGDASTPPTTPSATYGYRCPSGLVWRNVTETDHVCVKPAVRSQVRADNNRAAERRTGPPVRLAACPFKGSCLRYDIPCKRGFVWRAAVAGDYVCVTQAVRDQTQRDNLDDRMRKLQEASSRSGK